MSRIGWVLPTLTSQDIQEVSSGRHQMDGYVRKYIHANLGYRFITLANGKMAFEIEKVIKNGEWSHGKPLLNPGRSNHSSAGPAKE
jgi:hypothetical protein